MLRSRKTRVRSLILAFAAVVMAGASALFFTTQTASAHGTATSPPARQYSCWDRWGDDHQNPAMEQEDPMCYQAFQANPNTMWSWMSLLREGMAGQHEQRIPDGQLCSGGNSDYASLDEPGDWHTTSLGNDFTLHYEDQATHGADYYWVYVTRQGYDPTTQRLGWGDLERVVETGVYEPGEAVDIPVSAPGRSGHHVVYVIWQASHFDQTFYSCSDVWFGGGSQPDPEPTDPDPEPTEPDPEPTTDPEPSDPPAGGECTATYTVANEWGSGFTANVEVASTGGSGAWEVSWTWPGDQEITNSWSATLDQSGSSVTATGASYNDTLASGQSTSFGLNATYGGSNTAPDLTCAIG
ncbi:lytic polysaccharide monooxygenase auxiliary activity family 9 protein [Glycomyces xiaoerkulensis]|uniref:lytic polysaccharide monooxygenase auxiliary activity family 9 protein n=1 Tax=Glycomyces xiaoerkulensis TaxID=2038139 RepID=UPI0018E4A2E4|nr:lytic polysaccharide monooxygenase [Glycomyces xiaoerkulensis]